MPPQGRFGKNAIRPHTDTPHYSHTLHTPRFHTHHASPPVKLPELHLKEERVLSQPVIQIETCAVQKRYRKLDPECTDAREEDLCVEVWEERVDRHGCGWEGKGAHRERSHAWNQEHCLPESVKDVQTGVGCECGMVEG